MSRSPHRSSRPAPGRKTRERGPLGRLAVGMAQAGLVLTLLALIVLTVAVAVSWSGLPDYTTLKRSPNGQSIELRDTDSQLLASIGPSYGEWLPYSRIPATMRNAMIAVEDRRFDWHPGIDPIGIARSAYVNWQAGANVQGGSTITQQLARNLFLTSKKTFGRKGREVVLALALERKFSKEAILELYLNRVYFGGGAYGIDAASRRFFGHPATQLSIEEAAIIAGLVKAPSRYAPSADPEAARRRAATVITRMVDAGSVTPAQAAAADPAAVRFTVSDRKAGSRYFTDWVLTQLDTLIDETPEPIQVQTTLDAGAQRAAEAAIAAETPAGAQGALVAMAHDGAVKAMVGGRDYVRSNYNRAVTARRQPGSAFKLFVYLAALEAGMTPEDAVEDKPITIGRWSPRNSNGRYLGAMTLRAAFAQSVNTVAADIGNRVGFDAVAEMARRMGISTRVDRQPAMVLGTSDVTLIDMTQAYATVANQGTEARPYGITRITTADGAVLYERDEPPRRVVVAPFVAARMTDLLQAAVETGTGRAAQIGRPLAGKTGTTSSNKDGWFLGFTPSLTAGVWMGRDDARAIPGLAGGRAPARAFAAFMAKAVGGTPPEPLTTSLASELDPYFVEPDNEAYGITEGDSETYPSEDIQQPVESAPPRLDDAWLDETLNGPR
ncbi:transglycosylase domain-containing protein [Polymorphobacter sp.]|uniref:transglycosylase domain-containing protein n=1 Tax=Polymorphobacter sp. TaxID=1909290 RepID=UPI003F7129AA